MTLATVPPYDPDQITEKGDHAVVVGASMAGLLATRVLIDRFEAVTLIEKDPLLDEAALRSGIPQARHIHVMQKAGQVTLETLFPGYSDEVTEAGGLVLDLASDVKLYQAGDFLANGSTRIPQYTASRPVFEQVTRRRVAELDGVTIQDECHFRDYLVDDQGSTVEGVTAQTADGEREINAELVVAATGRASRTPAWLENNGCSAHD